MLIKQLQEQKQILIDTILKICIPNNDYHGVMDAAADIREIDAKLEILEVKK